MKNSSGRRDEQPAVSKTVVKLRLIEVNFEQRFEDRRLRHHRDEHSRQEKQPVERSQHRRVADIQ